MTKTNSKTSSPEKSNSTMSSTHIPSGRGDKAVGRSAMLLHDILLAVFRCCQNFSRPSTFSQTNIVTGNPRANVFFLVRQLVRFCLNRPRRPGRCVVYPLDDELTRTYRGLAGMLRCKVHAFMRLCRLGPYRCPSNAFEL